MEIEFTDYHSSPIGERVSEARRSKAYGAGLGV